MWFVLFVVALSQPAPPTGADLPPMPEPVEQLARLAELLVQVKANAEADPEAEAAEPDTGLYGPMEPTPTDTVEDPDPSAHKHECGPEMDTDDEPKVELELNL